MNETEKGKIWELKTKITNKVFEEYDFTATDFNSAIFENVTFKKCVLKKSNLSGTKIFYESKFENCSFIDLNFSNTTLGSNKGIYENCQFEKCVYKGKEFDFTQFIDCTFEKMKFNNVNFNGSIFRDCKLSGKFNDVSFNGIYETNPSKDACLNRVDFTNAEFGEFVNFYNCDLSTCSPPKGLEFDELLYQIYSNDPTVLSTGTKDRIVLVRK